MHTPHPTKYQLNVCLPTYVPLCPLLPVLLWQRSQIYFWPNIDRKDKKKKKSPWKICSTFPPHISTHRDPKHQSLCVWVSSGLCTQIHIYSANTPVRLLGHLLRTRAEAWQGWMNFDLYEGDLFDPAAAWIFMWPTLPSNFSSFPTSPDPQLAEIVKTYVYVCVGWSKCVWMLKLFENVTARKYLKFTSEQVCKWFWNTHTHTHKIHLT